MTRSQRSMLAPFLVQQRCRSAAYESFHLFVESFTYRSERPFATGVLRFSRSYER